jgi:hypothetical protein
MRGHPPRRLPKQLVAIRGGQMLLELRTCRGHGWASPAPRGLTALHLSDSAWTLGMERFALPSATDRALAPRDGSARVGKWTTRTAFPSHERQGGALSGPPHGIRAGASAAGEQELLSSSRRAAPPSRHPRAAPPSRSGFGKEQGAGRRGLLPDGRGSDTPGPRPPSSCITPRRKLSVDRRPKALNNPFSGQSMGRLDC